MKDGFVVWCLVYLPVSKWVTQQSYSVSRGKAYIITPDDGLDLSRNML
jgi:hypothetical protein